MQKPFTQSHRGPKFKAHFRSQVEQDEHFLNCNKNKKKAAVLLQNESKLKELGVWHLLLARK